MMSELTRFLEEMARNDDTDTGATSPPVAAASDNRTVNSVVAYLRWLADQPERGERLAYDALADAIEFLDVSNCRRLADLLAFALLVHFGGLGRSMAGWLMPWLFMRRPKLQRVERRLARKAGVK